MTNRRSNISAPPVPVPQSLAEIDAAIGEIGALQRRREAIQTAMNEALAATRAEAEAEAAPLVDRIKDLTEGLRIACEARRDALTQKGKTKTAKLGAGEISWRVRPPPSWSRRAARPRHSDCGRPGSC